MGPGNKVADKADAKKNKQQKKIYERSDGQRDTGKGGWLSLAGDEHKVRSCVPNVVFKRFFWGGFVLI